MNLRDQLRDILPEILPPNPAEAIKGTELIRLAKYRLQQDYSDATLRYHFSIMCCDPGSPIAKVEQGQGYYLRRAVLAAANGHATVAQARLGLLFESTPEEVDLAQARQQKFRAVFARDEETCGRFPFVFESSFAAGAPYENVWRCPDAAVIDWETGEVNDQGGPRLSRRLLSMKQSLGVPPFSLTSVKLKLEVTFDSYREDFFQAVSNARWGHAGELVIASPIADTQLVGDLRQLGNEFGLGIVIFGLPMDLLDELPPGYAIQRLNSREFEALQGKCKRQRLTSPRPRSLDWRRIEDVRQDNTEFHSLFEWLQRSLEDGRAWTWQEYRALANRDVPG